MKAVAYIRVSKEDENVENQKFAIQEYANKNGIRIVKWFQDVGVSGGTPVFERNGFKRLLSFSQRENIKTLVLYDITRFSRSFYDGIQSLRRLLSDGWNIITVSGVSPFSLNLPDNAAGKMLRNVILSLLLSMAEWYRLDVAERTKTGLLRAKAEGKKIGRPPIPKEKVQVIYELFKRGYSKTEIAKAVGVSRITVWRVLKNGF